MNTDVDFRNISAWSIRNPVFPLVVFSALLMAGIVSFLQMDIPNNPAIRFPAVRVIVNQPGAAPSDMETTVTQRVDTAASGLRRVDAITSYARAEPSETYIQFVL